MAASMGKAKELQNKKKQVDVKMESGNNNYRGEERSQLHGQMESEWIKVLRNQKNWGQEEQKWRWRRSNMSRINDVTEEEMEETVLTRNYDFDYVLKNHLLDDEQIVWADDVWGLQNFHQIPTSHDKHASNINSSHN